MRCFILAGGFATRLWPLTERRAKPLLPLKGKPIITHIVEKLPATLPITVSTNAVFAEDFKKWQQDMPGRAIEITIEDTGHDDHKLGALGAVAQWIWERRTDEDVLLIAGDNYIAFSFDAFLAAFRGNALIAAHDVGSLEAAKRFGTIVVDQSPTPAAESMHSPLRTVIGFEEKPRSPRSTLVSTGCSLLPRSTLSVLCEYAKEHPDNIGGIFEELLRRGTAIDCWISADPWKDIGSFDSYMAIHGELVGDRPVVDPTATVDARTTLRGSIVIGPGVAVTQSQLTDSILFGESRIDDCVLERCIVDEHCDLRGIDLSGKMLRMATILRRGER